MVYGGTVCPVHHQHFASAIQGLAQSILLQPNSSKKAKDYIFPLEDAFNAYRLLKDCGSAVSLNLWNSAKAWIRDAEEHSHSSILEAYQTALNVLDQFTSIQASLDSRHEKMQTRVGDLVSDAFECAVEHGEVERGVELLEQGRGILWNQLARFDMSLVGLDSGSERGRELVRKLGWLGAKLRRHAKGASGGDGDAYWMVLEEWNGVVEEIWSQEGFGGFLLPPRFEDLREAASGGPVIIVIAVCRNVKVMGKFCNSRLFATKLPSATLDLF